MEIGTLLYVKTTEEPTLFFSERPKRWYEFWLPQTKAVYTVRRPLQHPHRGIRYISQNFACEELETSAEQTARIFSLHKNRQAIAMASEPMDGPLSVKNPN